ncbi:recombinase family protein [Paenibacillus medicaginis]|uniref:Recombinase family protein n=1 Tax=Paenibacillus medicaginis TaxID=1470560 RepID=A0ABV5C4A5_9BACL
MMDGNTGIFGALYLRISRSKGENEDTLQNHRELMEEFCREHDYTFEVYEEIVSGGKHQLETRPQLQKLLRNLGRYQAIFAVSLDRLSRNGLISQIIKKECIEHDVKIITPTQVFDLAGSQASRTLYDVSTLYASMEYEMIGRRTKVNKMQRARRGEHVSGQAAYGYWRNPDTRKLEIYEPEAGMVRYIFKLYLQGMSCRKIADRLNGDGFKTQHLHPFQPTGIQQILRNPVYKGTLVFRNRQRIKKGQVYHYKTVETIVTEDAHPAIIPVEEWERVNWDKMDRGGATTLTRERPADKMGDTLLKDLLFCGICGKKLELIKTKSGAIFIRHCKKLLPDSRMKCNNQGMRLQLLNEEVLLQLQRHKGQQVAELLQQQGKTSVLKDLLERLMLIEQHLQENKEEQEELVQPALARELPYELLKRVHTRVKQHPVLQESRAQLLQQIRQLRQPSPVNLKAHQPGSFEHFKSLPAEKQNEILKLLIQRVHYERVMPEELRGLPPRSQQRQAYPFRCTIEYF